jgi:glutamate-5-semialdehyde dehydrogenase
MTGILLKSGFKMTNQLTTEKKSVIAFARNAKAASGILARLTDAEKNTALSLIGEHIKERADDILAANKKDVEAAWSLVETGDMAEALFRRLKLDEAKLADILKGIKQVAALEDPVGKVTLATELDEGLRLYRVNCPIGVVGVIFEARPDALVQIATLCLKSGNGVLLKGGREAEHSNRALFAAIQSAMSDAQLPADAFVLLESREDVNALLKAEGFVDLIIPRGSNALVRFVQENTNIPVLGHAEGICHIYVDHDADLQKALAITVDAKVTYPAACNAVETLLVHKAVARDFLPGVIEALHQHSVEVRCEGESIKEFQIEGVKQAVEEDWQTEYSDLILSIKTVESLDEAIAHINEYSSHHTDSIITEDIAAFDKFFAEVNSAGVYLNASTRFADGFRYGFGAEVGISTGAMHPRGPVGLEGLVTYKYKLVGNGHIVADYSGKDAKSFTHRQIS